VTVIKLDDLVGVWRLHEVTAAAPDGTVALPYGPDPRGLLFYTAGGFVSATIEPVEGRAMVAYAGRVRIIGTQVLHDVEAGTPGYPTGSTQTRDARFEENGHLVLAAEHAHTPGTIVTLTWHRAS
jgi:hypothetical protein